MAERRGLLDPGETDPLPVDAKGLLAPAEFVARRIAAHPSYAPRGLLEFIASMAPVTGEVLSARDAVNAFREGDAPGLLLGTLGAVPAIGLLGRAVRAADKGVSAAGAADTALDMSEAAWLARALEGGFAPIDWFHGTASDFPAFDPAQFGRVTENPFAATGAMFSRDPEVASDFAELAAERQARRAVSPSDSGPNVIKARLKIGKPTVYDLEGKPASNMELKGMILDAVDGAEQAGGTAPEVVIFRNMPTKAGDRPVRVSDVAVVLNPTRIRSFLAAFDPKKAGSGDLLAGLAALGLVAAVRPERNDPGGAPDGEPS